MCGKGLHWLIRFQKIILKSNAYLFRPFRKENKLLEANVSTQSRILTCLRTSSKFLLLSEVMRRIKEWQRSVRRSTYDDTYGFWRCAKGVPKEDTLIPLFTSTNAGSWLSSEIESPETCFSLRTDPLPTPLLGIYAKIAEVCRRFGDPDTRGFSFKPCRISLVGRSNIWKYFLYIVDRSVSEDFYIV